jgi:hypothetical protein
VIGALRALAGAALQLERLAGHVLEIRRGELDAHAADIFFRVAETAHGNAVDVFRVGLGLEDAPLFERRRERERADDVAVDVVLAPLGGGHAGQPADALLGGGIGALAEIAEQSRAGGEIDDAALRLLQIRIAFAHIEERGIEPRIDSQIELVERVIGQRDAGRGGLGVVHEHVDPSERLDGLLHDVPDGRLVVPVRAHVGLHRQDADAVEPFQLFLGRFEFLDVAACNRQIRALLGVSGRDAVADGADAAVLETGFAAAGDNRCLALQDSHGAAAFLIILFEF